MKENGCNLFGEARLRKPIDGHTYSACAWPKQCPSTAAPAAAANCPLAQGCTVQYT
jgi:hypothetical protein